MSSQTSNLSQPLQPPSAEASAREGNDAEAWLELGNHHMRRERLQEAIAAYEHAIGLDATLSEAHANLAIAYQQHGCHDAAIAAWRACLAIDPSDGEAWLDLGLLLQEQQRWEDAWAAFQRAREHAPSAALLVRMADLSLRQRDLEGAVSHYRQALAALVEADAPDLRAQILARLGVALHQWGHLEEAIDAYGGALKIQPNWQEINNHRNTALEQLKAALSHLRQSLHNSTTPAAGPAAAGADAAGADAMGADAMGPASLADRLAQWALALHRVGCLEEAIEAYGRALALNPELEVARTLRAKAIDQWQDPARLLDIARRFNLLGLFAEELTTLRRAAALAPDHRVIGMELALSLLRCGRFAAGWPLFDWRGHALHPPLSLPPWQPGQACEGLLILPEEGLGDQIMLASMLGEASGMAREPAVVIDPRLITLFARSFPHLRLFATGQPFNAAPFQAQIRMGSLAAHLRPDRDHFLARRGAYLRADPAKTHALRQRHLPDEAAKGALLCGLCWRSPSPANGVMKSLSLKALAGALSRPGVRLLSLQYGDTRFEREELRHATGLDVRADPEIDSFADIDNLAALIAACDVVVSVSTTTAHLAGALGQRTWLLIDSRLDWRWGLDAADTLWYPKARLFRQSAAGDWAPPLEAVRAELEALRHQEAPGQPPPAELSAPPPHRWVF
ncbi:MAG: tetratricopeptide repeat protein [Cyanobacteriota bacterium]|nr:tetratricopeptide repeat protein [Cyanobacteriota bacterium]